GRGTRRGRSREGCWTGLRRSSYSFSRRSNCGRGSGCAGRGCRGCVSEYFRHEIGEHSHSGERCARPDKKPAQPFYFLQFTEGVDVERGSPSFLTKAQPRKNNMPRSSIERLSAVTKEKLVASRKRTPYSPATASKNARSVDRKKMPTLSLYSLSVCTLCYEERMTAKEAAGYPQLFNALLQRE